MAQTTGKILCVDDEPTILEFLNQMISDMGFEVLTAESLPEVIEVLRLHGDELVLVLSDFNMPDYNGFDVRKAMLPQLAHVPFIILSGYVSHDMLETGRELKIDRFIDKPASVAELSDEIFRLSRPGIDKLRQRGNPSFHGNKTDLRTSSGDERVF